MAKYGAVRYGTAIYGLSLRGLTNAYLLARSVGYQKVVLTVDAEPLIGSAYLIVRSKDGAAEDPSSGVIIKQGVVSYPTFAVLDGVDNFADSSRLNNVVVPNGPVYYTLFKFDQFGNWTKEAATSVYSPRNRGGRTTLLAALPRVFTTTEQAPDDEIDFSTDLARFLTGFGVTLDEFQTLTDLVLPATARARTTIRGLHETLATSVGMPVEYTIGVSASSRLLHSAGLIYRRKGTVDGAATFVQALTGWSTDASDSPNLLLSVDDASFETSIGSWGATNATMEQLAATGLVTIPSRDFDYPTSPFSASGVAQVTMTTTSSSVSLPDLSADNDSPTSFTTNRSQLTRLTTLRGQAGTTYYLSLYARPITVSSTLTMGFQVTWYDDHGDVVSTTTHATNKTFSAAGSWSKVSRAFIAPAGSSLAAIKLTMNGAAGTVIHLDSVQWSESDTHYHDPLTVNIICYPKRINLLTRPSFEDGSNWTAVSGAVEVSDEEFYVGSYSLKVSGTDYEILSEPVVAVDGHTIRFSVQAKGDEATFAVAFFDTDGNEISVDVPADGDYSTINLPVTTDGSGEWERVDLEALVPTGTETMQVRVSGTGTTYLDETLLERTDFNQIYFDNVVGDSAGNDVLAAPSGSGTYSLLYPNRLTKLTRAVGSLPYYLPIGVRARVLLWDSLDPEVQSLVPYGA